MSEYQYYEFLAIDRPLTWQERGELRELSTRAEITATRFTSEYRWGSFKGDPGAMMQRYFDVHLFFAGWGTRRLMIRVPRCALDAETALPYVYTGHAATLTETADHVILDLNADREPGEPWEEAPYLGSMVDARSGLIGGDLRLLYLAWLLAVQWHEVEDDDTEPPVPPGLGGLSASLEAIADFLKIDEDLVDIAAQASPDSGENSQGEIAEWIAALPPRDKDKLLVRVASGKAGDVQALLLRRFRQRASGLNGSGLNGSGLADAADAPDRATPRTARELRDAAAAYKADIAKAVQEHRRAEAARREAGKATACAIAMHRDDLQTRE